MKAVSLFSGCGGSDLGLRQLGVSVEWANDIWAPACETYARNFPETEVVCGDIRRIRSFPRARLAVGCYPCQGYSQGGRRNPRASINYLFEDFARALAQVDPDAFIVENVAGLSLGANRELLLAQLEFFGSLGYTVNWRLLDARDYGLAQERKRIFIVGVRHKLPLSYSFPLGSRAKDGPKPWASQHTVIGEFPLWPEGEYLEEPLTWYYMSRRRRREWSEPAPCVLAHARSVALHPVSPVMEYVGKDAYRFTSEGPVRRYSYRECAALQGFPADFDWGDYRLPTKYRLVGNSVPPPLMLEVARPLVRALEQV